MPSPFPGMDPYLERAGMWEEVHTRLLIAIADALGPRVRPTYRVGVEQRTSLAVMTPDEYALVGKPDVLETSAQCQTLSVHTRTSATGIAPRVAEVPMPEEVTERFLEVRDVITGEVVTVIEVLSPTNKLSREGRSHYERKRLQVLGSATHLIEIDLLRAGEPLPFRVQNGSERGDYRIIISRAQDRPLAALYVLTIRDPLPDIPVPLHPGTAEPLLALNRLVHEVYDRAGFDLAVDYQQPPPPPRMPEHDIQWMRQLLRG